MSCCQSCSFCRRVVAKERRNARSSNVNKVCEKCFLCRSVEFCPQCYKCPTCCTKSACRLKITPFLGKMGCTERKPQSGFNPKRGLRSAIPVQTSPHKRTDNNKLLCRSPQEQLPVGGIASAVKQKCCGAGPKPKISGVLQPVVPCTKAQQPVAANLGSEQLEQFSEDPNLQNGDPGNNTHLPPIRGVGDFSRFQRRVLPYPHKQPIPEVHAFSNPRQDLSVQGLTFWPVHSPQGIYNDSQRSKMASLETGYKDPPVPRRLVGQSQVPPSLPSAHTKITDSLQRLGMAGKRREIRAGTQADFQFRRLPVRFGRGQGQTYPGTLASPNRQNPVNSVRSGLSGSTVHVPHWSPHSNRKTSSLGETTHEAHTVALEKQLEGPRVSGKGDPGSQVPPPPSKVVAGGRQCTTRSTFTPSKTCSANLYRRIKRRVGRSLRRAHCKRNLVSSREQITHKPVRAKSSIPSSKRLSNPRLQQDSVDSYRQHNSGGLYQQRGWDEVGLAVCPTVETTVLVHQATSNPQGTSHPRPVERDSRQAIQAWPNHSNRVVASSRSVQSYMRPVAPTPSGPVCHQIQQQTSSVCLTGTRSPGMGSGCPQPLLGGSGPIRLSTGSHLGQSGGEASGLSLQQNNSDCPRVAQHALVLGSGSNVKPDPTVSAQHTQPSVSAIQPGPSQEPVESESTCLAPRASAIKEQGFSEAVAARIEAPQRRSTRSVYEAKWTIFTKWCLSNQVDFRTPPLTAIADFLLHLFQDKKLQPGTIDGYRSAIADKLGNDPINISKDENLTRLLDSFHRDRPKGRRGIPSWNLSLVLHQLTKAPFEPLKEASLKHLTFKTVFLMALGSGKRRSEIHAWLHKNIRHQSDWSKVSLYPSPSFLSKNQLAREGPDSVAPVVIPALAPTLDKSLKGDRSLCPVRALRYYLDRTSDLRQNKELVFVSFKKGFDKDISPATVSSWIKQTVILCYELYDQQALTLHQVKAHDVRAFAASKAFQSGISLDQILSACHWKSHNTFTQFYLKDVAWADSELFHLGRIVAAQQVHQQAL